jgi:hypothetical protein
MSIPVKQGRIKKQSQKTLVFSISTLYTLARGHATPPVTDQAFTPREELDACKDQLSVRWLDVRKKRIHGRIYVY